MKDKSRIVLGALVLVLVAALLTGCTNLHSFMPRLQTEKFFFKLADTHLAGRYVDKELILVGLEKDGDWWMRVFHFQTMTLDHFDYEVEEAGTLGGRKTYLTDFNHKFVVTRWSDGGGLFVQLYPPFIAPEEITPQRFKEAVKPYLETLMEAPEPVMDAMREAAIDIGLVNVPTA